MNLTEMEKLILTTSRKNEYGDPAEVPVWMWSVIMNADLDAKQARGVISSLVKKGLIVVSDEKDPDERCMYLTELGIKYSEINE